VPTNDPGGIQDDGTFRSEGSDATVSMSKTLWSLASEWGGGASFNYRNYIARSFLHDGLRAYDDPETMEVETLPREFRFKTWSAQLNAVRQWGSTWKHQFQLGYSVSSQTPSLLPTFTMDPALQAAFIQDVFPRTEVVSDPFVEYAFFGTKYKTLRNVDTYELAEDYRLGPNVTVGLAQSLHALGSTFTFTRPSLTAGWTFRLGEDGFYRLSAGGQVRIQSGMNLHDWRTIDNTATAELDVASPSMTYGRVVGQVNMSTRWHDTQNSFYTVGSEAGLRGYGIGQFTGDRRAVGNVEARSIPMPVWVLRAGGVVFYEAGGADDSFHQMRFYHDVGFGVRTLIPQSSRELFRFDLAFPLVSAPGVRAGIPRFTAGFASYF
jgi:hypothetical protein